jgi:hypothetical protein
LSVSTARICGGTRWALVKLLMAETMVDPFERLQHVVKNVAISWGSFLLPLITPYVEKLADAGKAVRAWAGRVPHLTRLIGLATVGVFGFILAVAPFGATAGLWSGLFLHLARDLRSAFRCCPSSLYTFPCGQGLGSGLPCDRFPRL